MAGICENELLKILIGLIYGDCHCVFEALVVWEKAVDVQHKSQYMHRASDVPIFRVL